MLFLWLFTLLIWNSIVYSLRNLPVSKITQNQRHSIVPLQLWTISHEILPHDYINMGWNFHLIESKDLERISELTADCFYKPRLVLDTKGMSEYEIKFWNTVIKLYRNYDVYDFKSSNYWGYRTRSWNRIQKPSFHLSHDSFILVATPEDNNSQIAGLVEICLESPNGRLVPPIRFPFLSQPNISELEPYLCNLSVDVNFRRRKLGTILCKLSEELVKSQWGKNKMYLHVEKDNIPAKKLYESMGYVEMEYDIPGWEMQLFGLEQLIYYGRSLHHHPIPTTIQSIKKEVNSTTIDAK